jgi:hypothetical protein
MQHSTILLSSRRVSVTRCKLRLNHPLEKNADVGIQQIFGQDIADEVFRHTHAADGTPLFDYPRVQFKIVDAAPVLLGIKEGSELLQDLTDRLESLAGGDGPYGIVDSRVVTLAERLEYCPDPIEYQFATPWLGLNQKNFREYTKARSPRLRKEELARILAGNCLGLCKSLGVQLDGRIDACADGLTSIKSEIDGGDTIGFVGRFKVNLTLPDLIGLGRSSWRGSGTVSDR